VVTCEGTYAGGLCAVNGAVVSQSYATGDVTGGVGTFDRAGGCIGSNVSVFGTVIAEDCYARGNVAAYWVGGFAESNNGIIRGCYSTGTVTASGSSPPNEGGFCRNTSGAGTVTDCFWDVETSGEPSSPGGGTGKTTAEMKTKSTFTDAGWDFDTIWNIFGHCNDGYSCLRNVTPSCRTLVPTVTTSPATGLGPIVATLYGTLDSDGGEACGCGFKWGPDTGYGITTPTETKTAVNTFSQTVHGLFPNTTYHFRAFATNSFGTGYGDDRSFTTSLIISRAYALARE